MTRRMSYGEHFDKAACAVADSLIAMGVSFAFVRASHKRSIGVFDGVAGLQGRSHGVEIKTLGKHLEASQVKFSRTWNGCYHVGTNSLEIYRDLLRCNKQSSGISIPATFLPASARS